MAVHMPRHQKNCCAGTAGPVHVGHNRMAAGREQAGAAPASNPLRSPHFLVAATPEDCADYSLGTLVLGQYIVAKVVPEKNSILMCQQYEDGARSSEIRLGFCVPPHGLVTRSANRVLDTRRSDVQMIRCDFVLLFRGNNANRAMQLREPRPRPMRQMPPCLYDQ